MKIRRWGFKRKRRKKKKRADKWLLVKALRKRGTQNLGLEAKRKKRPKKTMRKRNTTSKTKSGDCWEPKGECRGTRRLTGGTNKDKKEGLSDLNLQTPGKRKKKNNEVETCRNRGSTYKAHNFQLANPKGDTGGGKKKGKNGTDRSDGGKKKMPKTEPLDGETAKPSI